MSIERKAIKETSLAADASALGTSVLPTISVCDVDLVHRSQISDDEETRFQMGVALCGITGPTQWWKALSLGFSNITASEGTSIRLVNVGAKRVIEGPGRLGYPVCAVCGDSRSIHVFRIGNAIYSLNPTKKDAVENQNQLDSLRM